jgi:Zn-dependent protease with chaperone function
MTVAFALAFAVAIALPHFLRLRESPPYLAAAIWLSALSLRALGALFAVVFIVFYLPGTELFGAITHWCWHTVLPLFAMHLGLDGHQVGDVATIAPAFVLAISLLSVLSALLRAGLAVARLVRRSGVGRGPSGSLIIGGPDVVVAAAGLTHPKVVVSAGALTTLDDEELAASLAHEQGHIDRRHRFILVFAEVCRALARFIPGTNRAAAALAYHLERDADEYAIARRHDPLALASAICKAAGGRQLGTATMGLAGGEGLTARLTLLADRDPLQESGRGTRGLRVIAAGLAALVIALTAAVPAVAAQGAEEVQTAPIVRHC